MRFMNKEVKENSQYKEAIDRANASKDISKATWEFMRYYEGNTDQGFYNKRLAAAKEIYDKYAGGSGSGLAGAGFGNTVTPYMTSGLYGGGGVDLGKAFWGSKLGGIAQRFGFKSPEQKHQERQKEIDKQRALERAKKAAEADIKKEATAAEIVKQFGIKDTDFDQYGNLKLVKADASILNNGTQDEKVKYHNQYLQLQQYVKEAEAAKKAKAKAKKEATAAELVKKYGIKDTDFDQYGNLKLIKSDAKLLNNGTQDDKAKYHNQYLQLQQYAKEAEAAKKAKADAIKKSSKITFNTAHSSDTFKADANHKSVIYKPTSSAVETAIRTSGNTSDMVSELKVLNIRKEATQMVHYLQIIAKNQYEMAKWLNPGAAKAGAGSSNGSVTRTAQTNMTKPPTIPPSQGFDRKANVNGKKDYGAIHAKNIEIARGGFFKDS
jgi:beta-galactosidase beta subunit